MTSPHDPGQQRGQQPPPSGFPQQPGGYPQYQQADPYAAPSAPDPGEPRRPGTVEAAFWLAVVVPVVATVLYAVSFFQTQGFTRELLAAEFAGGQQELAAQTAANVLVAFFVVATVVLVVLTALWIIFGFSLRAGRNWARVTLTVFAAVWVLAALSGLIVGGSGWGEGELPPGVVEPAGLVALGYARSALELVAMAAFIVLSYVKPSQWYFAARSYR